MDRFHAMNVFVAVAEHASFAKAARELHMSRPSVTRAIAALEDSVGAELLVRTTRTVALSQAGERYLNDCRRILEAVAEADASASGSYTTPKGRLVITAPVMFGRLHVAPVIHSFLQREPEVHAHALFLDRVVNLVEEGFDIGVRIGHLEDSALRATRVGEVTPWIVASPSYLDTHGEPKTPRELTSHTLLTYNGFSNRLHWQFGGAKPIKISVTPRLLINDTHTTISLVEEGLGLARVLSYQAGAGIANGSLVRVLTPWEPKPVPVHLIYPGGRRTPARTRAFLTHATEALRARAASGWIQHRTNAPNLSKHSL